MPVIEAYPERTETAVHPALSYPRVDELEFFIRDTTLGDMEEILDAAREFFEESNFAESGLTVDLENYRRTVTQYWRLASVKSFLARRVQDNELLGYVHVYCQKDYTVELIGETFQFYVRKDARGSLVGRALVEAACRQFDEWGCARSYVDCSPGMQNEKHLQTFINLWGKFGFKQIGITMVRGVKKHGKQSA
jgi:GNAT superfamily N-acetyltransferase